MKAIKFKKLILYLILYFLITISLYSANITGATLCGNFDDYATVYVNGNSIGSYNYINWDSSSGIKCISFSTSYLNASGSNVIAIKVQDTNGGEIWASWYMDVTYDNGQHAYVSSNQGGGKIASTYDCNTAPPNDGSGNPWYASSYANHSSWPNSVQVTGTTWGKVFYDPSTGRRLQPYSYDANGSSSGHGCLYMRWGVTLTPQNPPPGPTFSITKTASKTTNIGNGDRVTFTLHVCNSGGYITSAITVTDVWSNSGDGFQWDGPNPGNSAYGPNYQNTGNTGGQAVFPNGFEGNTCVNLLYVGREDYLQSWENCETRTNRGYISFSGGTINSNTITMQVVCLSPTYTVTRTRTPAPTSTYTRTLTPTPSRTLTPSPSRTPTPL